jgi:hypothetical protein
MIEVQANSALVASFEMFSSFLSKVFGVVFNSDRAACISQIKRLGPYGHARAMAELRMQTLKR